MRTLLERFQERMQLSQSCIAERRDVPYLLCASVARTRLAITEPVLPEDKLLFNQSMTGRVILSNTDHETLASVYWFIFREVSRSSCVSCWLSRQLWIGKQTATGAAALIAHLPHFLQGNSPSCPAEALLPDGGLGRRALPSKRGLVWGGWAWWMTLDTGCSFPTSAWLFIMRTVAS